ncbi:hypothetical protein Syun_017760 [Stephania yunnanensis]|uniref:Uncharacterized protein n=1 Tax=Stephania yunnanensis TaxID=152371 RepID=A0AAP0P3C3_9MAGN
MSYAAYKMMHWPTGIENCASGFITHCGADFAPQIPMVPSEDFETEWPAKKGIGPIPNLVVTAGNVLEVYAVRVQEEDDNKGSRSPVEAKRGGIKSLFDNLPHDAYKLIAVPSPIGGVLVISANALHYHMTNHDMPKSSFNVELDAPNATGYRMMWLCFQEKQGNYFYSHWFMMVGSYANYLGATVLS